MNIEKELQEIAAMVDGARYPETAEAICELLAEEQEDAYTIASRLREAEAGEDLPDFLFDFLVELYKLGIREGNAEAMNDLGALYYEGRGREPDYTKAFRLYEMAALNGSRLAQENLGYCYYYGRDVEVNYEKAFHFFLMGALAGWPVSLYKIGDMYRNGYYVPKNETEAFRIYDHCMATMPEEAREYACGPVYLRLGTCFLRGEGTAADPRTALICFQKAELYLADMVHRGDTMYLRSMEDAIEGQAAARALLWGED